MRIFFAGPLTDLKSPEVTKSFYKNLAARAEARGFTSYWAFLHGTDPELNPEVSPYTVYKKDLHELAKSDIMIAYIGEPTTGTGQELEYAKEHNIPVYLLFEKGKPVSRMVLGSPNVKGTIVFTSFDNALTQFDTLLSQLPH